MKKRIAAVLALCLLLPTVFTACHKDEWTKIKENTKEIELPKMYIETEDQAEVVSRDEYLKMKVSIQGASDTRYNIKDVTGQIRGRGNSTWDFCDKKSYKLKLDLKLNLLGMGNGGERDWALISNAREKSMLRNYSMFRLGEKMGLQVTFSRFVQVYMNKDYIGLYLLTETVETAENRLNIGDEGPDPDIGYLLELDKRAKIESKAEYDYFYCNDQKVPFAIKSHVENMEQNAFIKDFVEKADKAIASGNREEIEKYVDIRTAVDMYILEEFSKDRDVGFSSFFLYKEKGGKLTFCYPWDFDLALGNDSGEDRENEKNSPKIDYKGTTDIMAGVLNPWFASLTREKWFMKLVAERFDDLEEDFTKLFEEVMILGYSLKKEARLNYERWRIMGEKQLFEPYKIYKMKKYTEHVDYLVSWMQKRRIWLENYFDDYK